MALTRNEITIYMLELCFSGMRFAITQIKAALYTLVKKFDFSIHPTDFPPSSPTGMLFFSENLEQLKVERLPY